MPTFYTEDYDGEKADDAVAPETLEPVFDHSNDTKRLEVTELEDKAVKKSDTKAAAKKKS